MTSTLLLMQVQESNSQPSIETPPTINALDVSIALRKGNSGPSKRKSKKIMWCKWVFIVKYKANGSLERYKARLVAKGYTQTYEVNYQETFALVSKMNVVHVLLSLATN